MIAKFTQAAWRYIPEHGWMAIVEMSNEEADASAQLVGQQVSIDRRMVLVTDVRRQDFTLRSGNDTSEVGLVCDVETIFAEITIVVRLDRTPHWRAPRLYVERVGEEARGTCLYNGLMYFVERDGQEPQAHMTIYDEIDGNSEYLMRIRHYLYRGLELTFTPNSNELTISAELDRYLYG